MIAKMITYSRKKEKLRVVVYCRVSINHPEQTGSLKIQRSCFETII